MYTIDCFRSISVCTVDYITMLSTITLRYKVNSNDTTRTSMSKKIRIAMESHKAHFFTGDHTLGSASSIPAPPAMIFQATLLTLLCLEQVEQVPTPTELPRTLPDVLSDVPPQGHAPCLQRLLDLSPDDAENGLRPLPWLTPSIGERDPH
jgi:hypothetical protein